MSSRSRTLWTPSSFAEARDWCARHPRSSGRIGNNTYLSGDEESYSVCLHATNVVTFYADGSIRLRTGGYMTATTLDRIRDCLRSSGWDLVTERGSWFLQRSGDGLRPMHRWAFYDDGLTLAPHPVTGALHPFPPSGWRWEKQTSPRTGRSTFKATRSIERAVQS